MSDRSNSADAERPPVRFVQEKRFAVVMYGGVSLAIYINGVVQELLRLVRATVPDASGERVLYPWSELDGTECVYRRLAQSLGDSKLGREPRPDDPIRVRFVVDILSGTSAGGINSVFLAKALANNQSLAQLRELWIQEGDIAKLINDAASARDVDLPTQKPPQSLLNSKRMYKKLMVALTGMEDPKRQSRSSLVDELDLFVTATDITGLPIELQLADRVVTERKHRQVFHFAFRDEKRYGASAKRNDFVRRNDPFLAFAARCTSSFPFAFEPMRLKDIDGPLDREWDEFYRDYVAASERDGSINFGERAFGDGGYLDNKPFSYAIEALGVRAPRLPTDRWLIYIEPNPERVPGGSAEMPDALENTSAALSLARYETIREDLHRVLEHNQLLERVDRILLGSEEDIARREKKKEWNVKEWLHKSLDKMIQQKGISYGAYLRLRVELLTDDLARLVIANSGWDPLSDESRAIRRLVRAWRDARFSYYQDEDSGGDDQDEGRSTFHGFLLDYDLSFYIRRLEFVLRKASEMLPLGERARRCLKHCNCQEVLASPGARREFRRGLKNTRARLAEQLLELRLRWESLFRRDPEGEVGRIVSRMRLDRDRLLEVLAEEREAARSSAGADSEAPSTTLQMLEGATELIEELAKVLRDSVKRALPVVNQGKRLAGFEKRDGSWAFGSRPSDPEGLAAWTLGYYMHRFSLYDLITLPILYATGVPDEHDAVEVIRISPRDAKSLIDEQTGSRRKLGGTALANFGAFLDRGWRENDMLWGRLDGAERLVHAMLPAGEAQLRTELIDQAHEAILADLADRRTDTAVAHLTETVARFEPEDDSERDRLRQLRELVARQETTNRQQEQVVSSTLLASLEPVALRTFFKRTYEIYREPDREKTVRSLARATQVVGQMLEDLSEKYGKARKPAAWVARLGRLFWGLVEVSVPRGLLTLFARHWQRLVLMFALLMILGGVLFGDSGVRNVGWGLFGVIVAIGAARQLLADYIRHREGFLRLLQVLGVLAVLLLAANGVWHADEAWATALAWLAEKMS